MRIIGKSTKSILVAARCAVAVCVFFSMAVFCQNKAEPVVGKEHWVVSNGLKISRWEKYQAKNLPSFGRTGKIVLFVHGATWSGRPDFDLQIRDYSVMDYFARNGYDAWSIDIHGYGRSEKTDKDWSDTQSAANDIGAAIDYITALRKVEKMALFGWSWGTQTTGTYAMRNTGKLSKLVLFAMGWKGRPGSTPPPLPKEQYRVNTEAAARSDFIPGQFEQDVVDFYVKEALAADPRSPNGVRVDFSTKMPMLRPEEITVQTLIIHPEKDFLASEADTLEFFGKLGTKYKSYVSLPDGGHAILLEKNHHMFLSALLGFLNQP